MNEPPFCFFNVIVLWTCIIALSFMHHGWNGHWVTEIFSQHDSKIKICPYVPLHSFIRNLRCSDVLKLWKISSCKYLKFRKSIIFISAIHCKISLVHCWKSSSVASYQGWHWTPWTSSLSQSAETEWKDKIILWLYAACWGEETGPGLFANSQVQVLFVFE